MGCLGCWLQERYSCLGCWLQRKYIYFLLVVNELECLLLVVNELVGLLGRVSSLTCSLQPAALRELLCGLLVAGKVQLLVLLVAGEV
jgi:hypothetical protein